MISGNGLKRITFGKDLRKVDTELIHCLTSYMKSLGM